MATLTGTTIQSTYDSLLKVTDNDSITGSLKRITDGLGNNTPLYLSNSAVEIVSALNVTGAITGSNLSGTNTGDETKASIETKLGAATSSNSGYLTSTNWSTFNNKIAGTGTLNKLAKFSSSSSIADSTITDTGSAVTIGVATSVTGSLTASSIIKSGGLSTEFLKADGSVDSTTYTPTSRTLTINGTAFDLSANRSWSVGTVTSVSGTGTVSGLTLTGTVTSSGSLTLGGTLTLTSGQITTGLGYTPVPTTRTLTINGTTYDLSADRSWSIGTITGSGTTGYLTRWTGSTSLGNSVVYDNGTNVGIGTTNPKGKLGLGDQTDIVSTAGITLGPDQSVIEMVASSFSAGYGAKIEQSDPGDGFTYTRIFGRANTTSWTTHLSLNNTNGNVGIGTTNPAVKLDVSDSSTSIRSTSTATTGFGAASFQLAAHNGSSVSVSGSVFLTNSTFSYGTISPNQLNIYGTAGNGIRLVTNSAPISFATGSSDADFSTERMRITSAGNVGIGTSSPGSLLHVGGASGPVSTPTAIEMDGTYRTGAAAFNALKFYLFRNASESYGLGLGDLGDVQYWAGSTTTGAHRFFTSQTERMRITSAGNVGIGTTSPFYKFDVKSSGTGSNTFSALFYDSSTNGNALGISNATGVSTIYSTYVGTGVNSDLAFQTTTSAGAQGERMRITSTGNVGIGTTSPLHKLDIDGGASSDGYVVLRSSTGYAAGLKIGADGSTINTQEFLIQQEPTTKLAAIFNRANGSMIFGTNNSERMRITSGGNVLIGTTSDLFNNAKLQVNGGMTYLNLFNRRTASYTLSASDQSYIVEMNVGSANNLTVPPNSSVAFPIGTEIAVLQYGAGQTTIVAGSGVTLKSKSNALKISGQYAGCTLVKVGTDEWYVIGDLTL